MKPKKSIIWFRKDLRLHDNEALTEAIKYSDQVLPIYIFDERTFLESTHYGFRKTGKYRAKFIIESIKNLRESLQSVGSDLIVRIGKPEDIIFELAGQQKTNCVYCNRERTRADVQVQDDLEEHLWSIGQEIRYSRGKMLYYTADLPFPVTHTPDAFTQFRKEVEKFVSIRKPFESPEYINSDFTEIDLGKIPTLEDFNYTPFECDPRSDFPFEGGESSGLKRLEDYFWKTQNLKTYKESCKGLIGLNFSSKFSPYLSQGCLSPKKVSFELNEFEKRICKNKSTYQLFFELMRRDYLRLMAKKYGDLIFEAGGSRQEPRTDLKEDVNLLNIWIEGRTGVPLIDANMKELRQTGYISNRGRKNVASFLINDLNVKWQMGAEYFESILLDYDPCSNYGNWNFIAGTGVDTRENRYYNILSQAKNYDPEGLYVKTWLPELADLPKDKIHNPGRLTPSEQKDFGCALGVSYPKAMVDTGRWN